MDTHYSRRLGIPRLRKVYVTALGLIAALSVGQQVGVELAIRRVRNDGIAVNVAGRQHLLGQKIAKSARRAAEADTRRDRDAALNVLRHTLAEFDQAQQSLQGSNVFMGLGGRPSAQMAKRFAELKPTYHAFMDSAQKYETSHRTGNRERSEKLLKLLMNQSYAFTEKMEPVVEAYSRDSKEQHAKVQWMQLALGAGTLGMLVVVGMFAFKPSINALRETAAELEASHLRVENQKEAARQSEARFRGAFENAPTGIALVGPEGDWQRVNRALCEMLGRTEDELLTDGLANLTHPDDLEADANQAELMLAGKIDTYAVAKRFFHKDGQVVYTLLGVTLVRDFHGKPIQSILQIQDVTAAALQRQQLEEANDRLERLALTDGLTGVYIRRAFGERLETELSDRRHPEALTSLILLDVDHFKSYNDTYGHPAGDDVLREVASILMNTVRPTDFVARYGGEEFAVILPDTPREGAMIVAERVRQALEAGDWQLRQITASLGVATTPHGSDPAAFVESTDGALYRSKQNGRNRVSHAGPSLAQAA